MTTMTDIARDVTGPTALDLLNKMKYRTDDVDALRPGVDYRKGHLYFTLPVDRDEEKEVGKGAAKHTVTERVQATICVRSAGPSKGVPTIFPYDEDGVRSQSFRFPQTFTQALTNRWPMDSLTAYLGGTAHLVDPAVLFADLKQVYLDHVEYPDDIYYDIVPLFTLGSYVFRMFQSVGYIHFNGTAASGKSQNLKLFNAFGLNTVWASNMSSASLFRQVAGCPGIIAVDEAESEHWKTEKGQELRQLLLAGYVNGSMATRAEKAGANDRFITVSYDVYSPKVLASIDPLDSTLGSRCLVVPMQRAIRNIPDFDANDPRWIALRGRIYTWAMQHHAEIDRIRLAWADSRATRCPDLRSRAWEVAQVYVVLAEHIGGPAFADRLVAFFTEYFAKAAKAREDSDKQYTLIKALPRVLATVAPHPGLYYGIKDIHEVVSTYLEEDAKEYYKTRTVARHLTSLGFRDSQAAKGGKQVRLLEADVRNAFDRHHITPFDEDVEWVAGTRTYQDASAAEALAALAGPAQPAEPTDDRIGWLDAYPEMQ